MPDKKLRIWMEIPWEKRVSLAVKNKKFTDSDRRLAALWITDPISELFGIIDLREGQLHLGPTDIYLVLDGIYFTKAVEEDDVFLALNCMKSMNNRVKKLYDFEPWPNILKVKIDHGS